MKTRLLTGVPAALALAALIFFGDLKLLRGIIIIMSMAAYWEFETLLLGKSSHIKRALLALVVGATVFLLAGNINRSFWALFAGLAFVLLSVFGGPVQEGDFEKALTELTRRLLGFIYIVFLFGFLFPIVSWPQVGRSYLLLLFLTVFIGDTAAYFIGSRWGKKKLASKVSPGKTQEGALAALLSAVVVSILWVRFLFSDYVSSQFYWKVVLFSPFLSVFAQAGDLFESILKRSQSQKDSGTFMPGHGGILDRIDGLVFSAPLFYWFIFYVLEGDLF